MKKLFFNFGKLLLLAYIVNNLQLFSQPFTIWNKSYNGPANQQDSSVGICVNSQGMVFVTGWSLGSGTSYDIVTIRYNPATGDTIWVRRYSTALEERVSAIACDNNSVCVTGWKFNPGRNMVTIKYDVNGNEQWVREYNGTGNGGDYGFAAALDGSGNVYSAGRSDVGGAQKMTILKYDPSGNMVSGWPCVYSGPLSSVNDEARFLQVDNSANVYVTGRGNLGGLADILTLKISSGGTVLWAKKYFGNANNEDGGIELVLDNTQTNLYVGGYTFGGGVQNYVTLKYLASTGDSVAAAFYDGTLNNIDIMTAMAIDNSNNVYVTGYSFATGTGFDYATVKYNSSLVQQWVRRTTNSGSDFPHAITVDAPGNIYVTGSSVGTGTGYDYLTIAYRSDGTLFWEKRENGSASGNDYASGVVTSDTDRVFVTGSANNSGTGIVFYTLRYSNISAIEPISGNLPVDYSLQQNYPNPFNPSTSIRFDIPKASNVKVLVFDVLGREVGVLADEYLRAGEYRVEWNAVPYSSGIYFYTLKTDNFTQTKKMILTK
jgi:Secretion system C-terminal sorting domain/Beta-propeller repeat